MAKQTLDYDGGGFGDGLDYTDHSKPRPNTTIGKTRKAISEVGSSAYDSFYSDFTDTDKWKQAVVDELPTQHKYVYDSYEALTRTGGELYDQFTKETRPILGDISKKLDDMVGDDSFMKGFTRKIREKFYDPPVRQDSEETLMQEALARTMNETFGGLDALQQNRADEQEKRQTARDITEQQIGQEQHEETLRYLKPIADSARKLEIFKLQIESKFMKKNTELAFRSYILQGRMLEHSKKAHLEAMDQLKSIVSNTALPDFLKIEKTERFKEMMRDRMFGGLQNAMFGEESAFGQMLTKIKRDIGRSISTFSQGLQMAAQNVDMAGMMFGKDSGMSAFESMGMILGGELGGAARKRIINPLMKELNKNPEWQRKGHLAAQYASDPRLLFSMLRNDERFKSIFEGPGGTKIQDLFEQLNEYVQPERNLRKFGGGVEAIHKQAIPTERLHRVQTDVIPGYLARILQQVTTTNTKTATPMLVYDYSSNSFVERAGMKNKIGKLAREFHEKSDYTKFGQSSATGLLEELGLKEEDKETLSSVLSIIATARGKGGVLTGEDIRKFSGYEKASEAERRILDIINSKAGTNKDAAATKTMFNVRMAADQLRGKGDNMGGLIQRLIDQGHADILEESGIIEPDPDKPGAYRTVGEAIEKMQRDAFYGVTSDINKKRSIKKLSPEQALRATRRSNPNQTWTYKNDNRQNPRIKRGPMAQDVRREFGEEVAPNGESIDLVSMNGALMSAIQKLAEDQERLANSNDGVAQLKAIAKGVGVGEKTAFAIPGMTLVDYARMTLDQIYRTNHILENKSFTFGMNMPKFKWMDKDKLKEKAGEAKDKAMEVGDEALERMKGFAEPLVRTGNKYLDGLQGLIASVVRDGVQGGKTVYGKTKEGLKTAKEYAWDKPTDWIMDVLMRNEKEIKDKREWLYKKSIEAAGKAIDFGTSLISDKIPAAIRSARDFVRNIKDNVKRVINPPRDVYTKGSSEPAMRAQRMRGRAYADETGKLILGIDDLLSAKGNIRDILLDEVVLTASDLADGVYDDSGRELRTTGGLIAGIGAAAAQGAWNLAQKGYQWMKEGPSILDKGKEAFEYVKSGLGNVFSNFSGGIGLSTDARLLRLTAQIRDLLAIGKPKRLVSHVYNRDLKKHPLEGRDFISLLFGSKHAEKLFGVEEGKDDKKGGGGGDGSTGTGLAPYDPNQPNGGGGAPSGMAKAMGNMFKNFDPNKSFMQNMGDAFNKMGGNSQAASQAFNTAKDALKKKADKSKVFNFLKDSMNAEKYKASPDFMGPMPKKNIFQRGFTKADQGLGTAADKGSQFFQWAKGKADEARAEVHSGLKDGDLFDKLKDKAAAKKDGLFSKLKDKIKPQKPEEVVDDDIVIDSDTGQVTINGKTARTKGKVSGMFKKAAEKLKRKKKTKGGLEKVEAEEVEDVVEMPSKRKAKKTVEPMKSAQAAGPQQTGPGSVITPEAPPRAPGTAIVAVDDPRQTGGQAIATSAPRQTGGILSRAARAAAGSRMGRGIGKGLTLAKGMGLPGMALSALGSIGGALLGSPQDGPQAKGTDIMTVNQVRGRNHATALENRTGKATFYDTDGDGTRDTGATKMLITQDRERQERQLADNEKSKESQSRALALLAEKDKKDDSFLKGITGMLGNLFSFLTTRFGGVFKMLGGAGRLLGGIGKGAWALGKGAVRGAGAAIGALGRGVVGSVAKRGLLGAATNALRVGAVAATATGGMVGTSLGAVAMVARFALGPVGLGLAALQGAWWAGKKIYKYVKRNDTDAFGVLRMAQYGLTPDQKDQYNKFLAVEELVKNHVSYSMGSPSINSKNIKPEELMDIFDCDKKDQDHANRIADWFENRFKPFIINALATAKELDPKSKYLDLNYDNMDEAQLSRLSKLALMTEGPYDVSTSPFKEDAPLPNTLSDAKVLAAKLADIPSKKTKKGKTKLEQFADEKLKEKKDKEAADAKQKSTQQQAELEAIAKGAKDEKERAEKDRLAAEQERQQLIASARQRTDAADRARMDLAAAASGKSLASVYRTETGKLAQDPSRLANAPTTTAGVPPVQAPGSAMRQNNAPPAQSDDGGRQETAKAASTTDKDNNQAPAVQSLPKASGPIADPSQGSAGFTLNKSSIDINNINPAMKNAFFSMSAEYNEKTGKKILVTDGKRDTAEQAKLFASLPPGKAAKPGTSLHEFGAALDINSPDADNLEKMGLMRKYGFTRPVGGETWHIEPAGIQGQLDRAKKDPNFLTSAVQSSYGRGGGGNGIQPGARKYSRNNALALKLLNDAPSTEVKPEEDKKDQSLPPPAIDNKGQGEQPQAAPRIGPAMKRLNAPGSALQANMGKTDGTGGALGVQGSEGERPASVKTAAQEKPQQLSELPKYDPSKPVMTAAPNPVLTPPGGSVPYTATPQFASNDPKGGKDDGKVVKVPKNAQEYLEAIKKYAAETNKQDPRILQVFAGLESSMGQNLKAPMGSAEGPFQFMPATWKEQMGKHASKYNIPSNTPPGDLRASVIMTSEYLDANTPAVKKIRGDQFDILDSYTTHMFGPGGAKKFAQLGDSVIAADVMTAEARYNPNVFFDGGRGGRALTVGEIRTRQLAKIEKTAKTYNIDLNGLVKNIDPNNKGPMVAQAASNDASFGTKGYGVPGQPENVPPNNSRSQTAPTPARQSGMMDAMYRPNQMGPAPGGGPEVFTSASTSSNAAYTERTQEKQIAQTAATEVKQRQLDKAASDPLASIKKPAPQPLQVDSFGASGLRDVMDGQSKAADTLVKIHQESVVPLLTEMDKSLKEILRLYGDKANAGSPEQPTTTPQTGGARPMEAVVPNSIVSRGRRYGT